MSDFVIESKGQHLVDLAIALDRPVPHWVTDKSVDWIKSCTELVKAGLVYFQEGELKSPKSNDPQLVLSNATHIEKVFHGQ